MKKRVWLSQVNNLFGNQAFLPYSVGLLQAYAQTFPEIRDAYEFCGFVYLRENIEDCVRRMGKVDVFGASCYIWNFRYSMALARAVKVANPQCLIVAGGPHVPTDTRGFFEKCPVDIAVHFEGEETFTDVLLENLNSHPDFSAIPGTTAWISGAGEFKGPRRERTTDLDKIPSPYLTGVFDRLVKESPMEYHPSQETHRGCPYQCLSGDTLVHLDREGRGVPIKKLADQRFFDRFCGEQELEVWSLPEGPDFFDWPIQTKGIKSCCTGRDKRLVRVNFCDGTSIDCTPDHKFRTKDQRAVEAWDLRLHEVIEGVEFGRCLVGETSKQQEKWARREHKEVHSIVPIPGFHDTYCLEVPETGWFYANNVLVHNCQFCDWGSSTYTKVRRFPDERIISEYEWFARNQMSLLYNCDANYAMFPRDVELTRRLVETKSRYGYPQKFRAAFAKNSGSAVFTVSKMLNDAGMSKGATLSFQSMDRTTLEAVKRKNIGIEVYSQLMKQYRQHSIPTYSEIIIGLPGETYESFANGLDTLLNAGAHDSISCYLCECLPNSELSQPEYRDKYGIKSVEVPVLHFHAEPPEEDPALEEKYELVTSTNSLPSGDWLKCCRLAWIVQCGHCLGLTQKIAVFCKAHLGIPYRSFYEQLLRFADRNPKSLLGQVTQEVTALFEGIPHGRAWGMVDKRFGKVTWPPEEGAFLKLVADKPRTFWSLREFVGENLLGGENWSLAGDLITYQREILNLPDQSPQIYPVFGFGEDIHSVIEGGYEGESRELKLGVPYRFVRDKACPSSSLEDYARTVVWHGRKGGSMFHKVEKVQ